MSNTTPTGSVTINGYDVTPKQGDLLAAVNTLSDPDGIPAGTITYEWRAGSDLVGVAATLRLDQAMVGRPITVTARYTDGAGNPESVTSAPTPAVENVNDLSSGTREATFTLLPVVPNPNDYFLAHDTIFDEGLKVASQTRPAGSVFAEFLPSATPLYGAFYDGPGVMANPEFAVIVTAANGGPLSFSSIDLDSLDVRGSVVTAVGTRLDGTTVQQTLTTDTVAGLQTFSLHGFDNLRELDLVPATGGPGFQFDNFVFDYRSAVSIAGFTGPAPMRGETLTASNTIDDPDGLGPMTYQWQADGTDIAGATAASLTLGAAEVGKSITVVARYIDQGGTAESLASSATQPVIQAVNHAPELTPGASAATVQVEEDARAPAPISVAALMSDGSITDADGTPVEAVAVIGADERLGSWQYSLDGGTRWASIRGDIINGTWSDMGLLLGPDALLRFMPSHDMNGTSADALTLRAWDMTAGEPGEYVDTGTVGGASSLSPTVVRAGVSVTMSNDAPVFALQTGRTTTDFAGGSDDDARAVALQPDGKLLVAGRSGSELALARYLPDGSLDPAFGNGGKVLTALPGSATGAAVQVDANGKITVAGSVNGDFAVLRYNGDGTPDTTFGGGDGVATGDLGAGDDGNAMTVQGDGKIVVAGTSGRDFGLARFNVDGTLDTTFGNGGKVVTDFGSDTYDSAFAVGLESDGTIVVGGTSATGDFATYQFALARYRPDGSLDPLFSGGKVTIPIQGFIDTIQAITVQPDGKIVATGFSNYNVAVLRLNGDGTPDTTFGGGDGVAIANLGSYENARAVAVQADGKILVGGENNNNFFLTRFNSDGSQDTGFAHGAGVMMIDLQGGSDSISGLVIQPDGMIVAVGRAGPGASADFAVARFDADGMPDPAFGDAWTPRERTYTEGGPPAVMDPSASVYDIDLAAAAAGGNYAGAVLTLQRAGAASPEDSFTGTGPLAFVGGRAMLSGVDIGAVTSANGVSTISFNTNATGERVNEALASLAYANSSTHPPAQVDIEWTFSDGNTGAQGTGGALTATRVTTMEIVDTNSPPIAVDDAASATEAGVSPGVDAAGSVLANDSDPDPGDTLVVSAVSGANAGTVGAALQGQYGTLTLQADGSYLYAVDNHNPVVDALRLPTDTLTDTFGYTVQDTHGGSASAQLLVTIHGANDPIAVAGDSAAAVEAGAAPGVNPSGNVLANDTDPDAGDTKTVAWLTGGTVGQPLHGAYGTLRLAADGSYTYIVDDALPAVDALRLYTDTLKESFIFGVQDAAGNGGSAALEITIHGANDAPVAVADRGQAVEAGVLPGSNATGNVLANDTDVDSGDTRNVSAVAGGTLGSARAGLYGALTMNADGSYTYVVDNANARVNSLAGGQSLHDPFSYTVRDAAGATSTTTLDIAIAGSNDPPSGAVTVSGSAVRGQTLTASNTLSDPEGMGPVSYQWNADGTSIAGAVGSNYVLTQAEVGKSITVTASYTDLGGTFESRSSGGTAPVAQSGAGAAPPSTDGNDILYSSSGRTLAGGLGDDTYVLTSSVLVVEYPNQGTDQVLAAISYTLTPNVENLQLTGSLAISGTGNDLANVIIGNDAANIITGAGGADTMTGGGGADRFVFLSTSDSSPGARDTITDFSSAQGDRIDLRSIDASTARGGQQHFVFIGTNPFSADASAQLRFDPATHTLQGSINADSAPELVLTLTGLNTLAGSDLLL